MLCGCSNSSYKSITKDKALKLINEKQAILIDVRSDLEYQSNHIDGSISFPIDTINNIEKEYDKNSYLIVYCQSGSRSKKASNILIELGYKHVYDLGSINNWD